VREEGPDEESGGHEEDEDDDESGIAGLAVLPVERWIVGGEELDHSTSLVGQADQLTVMMVP